MKVRRKEVKGRFYYYLEESIRLQKPKVYSISLGSRIPPKTRLERAKKGLVSKIYASLLGGVQAIYLPKERLIELEQKRMQYEARLKKLTKGQRDEKEEIDAANFVYTTLSTEGLPITMQDAQLAYKFSAKGVRNVRDESLRISLDMIKGMRKAREGQKGISQEFILGLHSTIMEGFPEKNPGKLRSKPAYIYLKSYGRAEEIGFKPPPPADLSGRLEEFVSWYNSSLGRLNSVEFAALAHLRFYSIHPFDDGNKRMSRLLLNKALHDCGYPLLNISKKSEKYFDALIKSAEKADERPFVEFVAQEFLELCRKR